MKLTDEKVKQARQTLKDHGLTDQEIDYMLSGKKSVLSIIQWGFIILNAVFVIHILMRARP